jgi:hypothetical protein
VWPLHPLEHSSPYRAGTIRGEALIDFASDAGASPIFLCHGPSKRLYCGLFDQRQRTASEAASHHTRAIDAGYAKRQFAHQVEFGTTHFVIQPQTLMRFPHERSKLSEIAAFQGLSAVENPLVFSDHMAAASMHHRVKLGAELV